MTRNATQRTAPIVCIMHNVHTIGDRMKKTVCHCKPPPTNAHSHWCSNSWQLAHPMNPLLATPSLIWAIETWLPQRERYRSPETQTSSRSKDSECTDNQKERPTLCLTALTCSDNARKNASRTLETDNISTQMVNAVGR